MQYDTFHSPSLVHAGNDVGLAMLSDCILLLVFWFFFFLVFCYLLTVTPEGFITVVANEDLEKARAYLNQVPWD